MCVCMCAGMQLFVCVRGEWGGVLGVLSAIVCVRSLVESVCARAGMRMCACPCPVLWYGYVSVSRSLQVCGCSVDTRVCSEYVGVQWVWVPAHGDLAGGPV